MLRHMAEFSKGLQRNRAMREKEGERVRETDTKRGTKRDGDFYACSGSTRVVARGFQAGFQQNDFQDSLIKTCVCRILDLFSCEVP